MVAKTSGNPNDFCLPDLGEGLEEAELLEWCVKVGQEVQEHDTLVKMETAKAMVEIPSPRGGVIAEIYGKPGEMIKTGAALVTFKDEKGAAAAARPAASQSTHAEPNGAAAARTATSPGRMSRETQEAPAAPKAAAKEAERTDEGTVVGNLTGAIEGVGGGKVRAAPAVRRLARDLGVDIEQVSGTGIGGRITNRDVEAAVQGAQRPAPTQRPAQRSAQSTATANGDQRIAPQPRSESTGPVIRTPFRGVRRTIAERLRHSVNHAVHFTVMDEADVTSLDALRRKLAAASNEKLSFLPFIASAVCRLLTGRAGASFARLNSTVDDENQQVLQHHAVHLGIATDTESGLMVPVIRNAEQLGVLELGRCVTDLAERSRDRSVPAEDLRASTFTLSNFGALAGRFATPIINYPEVGILAIGRAREGVIVHDGMLGVGKVLPLSLSADHRVIDGATAATALAKIIELLQSPETLLPPARKEPA